MRVFYNLQSCYMKNALVFSQSKARHFFVCIIKAMTDHLMYRISLENTTYFDFGREKWIKNLFLFLSDPAFSDRSIRGEVIKTGRWDLKKGRPRPFNRGDTR